MDDAHYGDALPLDIERYREHLKDMNLSDAQATDMLNALWTILSAFVDLAFGVDSAHLALTQLTDSSLETDAAADKANFAQQPGTHATKDTRS